jgi:hypothetical protein
MKRPAMLLSKRDSFALTDRIAWRWVAGGKYESHILIVPRLALPTGVPSLVSRLHTGLGRRAERCKLRVESSDMRTTLQLSVAILLLTGCQQSAPNSGEPATTHVATDQPSASTPAADAELIGVKPPETFDIHPYIGPLPLKFGMRQAEVHKLLGSPEHSRARFDDAGVREFWHESSIQVFYDKKGAVEEVTFLSGSNLLLSGTPLWTETQRDPNPALLKHDPDPVESVGILIFLGVGISTDGFHGKHIPEEERDPTLTAFRKGAFDEAKERSHKPDLSKYRSRD